MIIDQLPSANPNLTDETVTEQGTNLFKTTWQKIRDLFFGSSASFASDVTVGGVLDVSQRRCYDALSTPGWYRVLTVTGQGRAGRAWTIDLHITRTYSGEDNEVHSIKLLGVYDSFSFTDEVSKSNALGIDKIRYTLNGNVGYIDIHYSLTSSNGVSVDFDVHTRYDTQSAFTANSLAGVAPSPSGETVMTEYTFAANTINPFVRQISYTGTTDANGNLEIPQNVANYNSKNYILQYASVYATALVVSGGLLYVKCFKYDGTANANANVTVYLLEN